MSTKRRAVALGLCGFFHLVAVPLNAPSQTPSSKSKSASFNSYEEFLLSRAEDARAATAGSVAILPRDSAKLDTLIRGLLPYADAFFVIQPNVYWADGKGSSSHPGAGVGIDRARLIQLRDSLRMPYFNDLVLFVLAHELAHIGQFRYYPLASLADSGKRRPIECQADLWAGALLVNYMLDSLSASAGPKGPPTAPEIDAALKQQGERLQQVGALAYHIGTPIWDDQRSHPQPTQRALCLSRGANSGMHMRLVRMYERAHDPKLLEQINEWRARDPRWFGPGANLWDWTNGEAKALVHYGGARWDPVGGPVDLIGLYTRLAVAAERGESALAAAAHGIVFPDDSKCEVDEDRFSTTVQCTFQHFQSDEMLRDGYDDAKALVWGTVSVRRWTADREESRQSGRRMFYALGDDAIASASVTEWRARTDGEKRQVRVSFTAWKRRR